MDGGWLQAEKLAVETVLARRIPHKSCTEFNSHMAKVVTLHSQTLRGDKGTFRTKLGSISHNRESLRICRTGLNGSSRAGCQYMYAGGRRARTLTESCASARAP